MRVAVANSARSFAVGGGESVLDAALAASFNLPHGCKGGNCGACRARLIRGDIHYPNGPPLGLSDAETADGYILLCQARALGDLTLELQEVQLADQAVLKRMPCRIERTVRLSHDVLGLFLRLPAAEPFAFEAGQYLDVLLQGGRRRSFSIVSPPHDARLLELHVRRVSGGEFTDRLFSDAVPPLTLLNIEGPLGRFVYRPSVGPAAPLLFIGGGTGIAPLLSILRHVIETGIERDMVLYWGVRAEADLYARATLDALAARSHRFRWTPVLSEAPAGSRRRVGWVHEVALQDIEALEAHEVYAAGPPQMIDAIRREYAVRGADARRLFTDSFDYAPDSVARQRSSAVSRS